MSDVNVSQSQSTGGGCGCISIVATVLVLWALCFGVTVDGKHYEIHCSAEHGVTVEK